MVKQNEAENYNNIRRIIFSTYHKDPEKAFESLEGNKKILGIRAYVGLKAELSFYANYFKKYSLTTSLDAGDHTDFTGKFDDDICRFDVTTNLTYKKLKDYERFQKEGAIYKLVLINKTNYALEDIVDINFPFCEICGDGRVFDLALLLGDGRMSGGSPDFDYEQKHISFCSHCNEVNEIESIYSHRLYDIDTYISDLKDINENIDKKIDINLKVENYCKQKRDYLSNQMDTEFVAICGNTDVLYGRHLSISSTKVYWKLPLISEYLPDDFEEIISY